MWVVNEKNHSFWECSHCHTEAYWDTDYGQQLFDFCPYCGAKQKGARNERSRIARLEAERMHQYVMKEFERK